MAPRSRYPSDEKRLKRPSGVVVGFSILHPDPEHPEHSDVFDDPELRGIWVGLLVLAGQAFAGRTGDRVTLSRGQVAWVSGRSWRRGLAKLELICARMGYELTSNSDRSWVVHIKNLSQNQGWSPRRSADSTLDSADYGPPPSPSPSPSPKEEKNSARAPSSAPSSRTGTLDLKAPKPAGKRPQKPKAPKPSSRAIAIYCEEFKASIGKNPIVPTRDFRDLGATFEQVGEDRFRAALRKFFEFGERDQWIKSQGYSAREFLRQITKCDLHAQKTQGRRVLDEDPPEEPDPNWREYLGDSYGGRIGSAS